MIQQVLELTLNHLDVQFQLIGLIFYSINSLITGKQTIQQSQQCLLVTNTQVRL